MLMEAMELGVVKYDLNNFYYLARTCLIKDEKNVDRFDQVFSEVFQGITSNELNLNSDIPENWLKNIAGKVFTEEEKKEVQALGGWEKLLETLKARLLEQKRRHQGGTKWIGTGGTSPYGGYGYNPEGVRIGQYENKNFKAVKVWDERTFKDLDHSRALGPRNMKLALRKLRHFAREGQKLELDLDKTISSSARHGFLDLHMRAERHNLVKVLIFFDVGGSMGPFIEVIEQLFSSMYSEFKNLEYYYFHNCLYERVWKDSQRRHFETILTQDLLNRFGREYKVIFVGDASMSPYEIFIPGGSVEHLNSEPGDVWLKRFFSSYPKVVWLNPINPKWWEATESITIIQHLINNRMFPVTIEGLENAITELSL